MSTWLGKPYQFGCNEKTGIDCRFFVWRYCAEAGIEWEYKEIGKYYPRDWLKSYKGPDPYLEFFEKNGRRVELIDVEPGDFLLFNIISKKYVSHSGIVLDKDRFIHCPIPSVQVSRISAHKWQERLNSIFRLKVLEELPE